MTREEMIEIAAGVDQLAEEAHRNRISNLALTEKVERLEDELETWRRDEPRDQLLKDLAQAKRERDDYRSKLAKSEYERDELLQQRTAWAEKHG